MQTKSRAIIFVQIMAIVASIVLLSIGLSVDAQTKLPSKTPAGSSLEKRIAQRKAERKIKLDEPNTIRLQSTCVQAQTKIRQLRDNYVVISDKRSEVYRKVDAKLWFVVGSLRYIDKDTFKLEQQRIELLKQVKINEASLSEFRLTLDDMANMNCKADVVGFKSLLETSKLYNAQIRTQSDSIRTLVLDQIVPTLSSHAEDLKPKQSTQ